MRSLIGMPIVDVMVAARVSGRIESSYQLDYGAALYGVAFCISGLRCGEIVKSGASVSCTKREIYISSHAPEQLETRRLAHISYASFGTHT